MEEIILIGTGPMAQEYAKVLIALGKGFTVVGRGEKSGSEFENKCGLKPHVGGLENFLSNNDISKNCKAIIATGTESLMQCLLSLTQAGIENILVEKPTAISIEELLSKEELLRPFAETIFVAYNRRFYSSVVEAKRLIEEDGGLQSMSFEFTEWLHKIEPLLKAPGVKENWFFANSSHVVDLAFYLAGLPERWHAYAKSGSVSWHDKTNFSGAGITVSGVLFSYMSNWESAGRWAIELFTNKRRIYLKPLESLLIQEKGSLKVEEWNFDKRIDEVFKPGLYNQTVEFFNKQENMLTLKDHFRFTENILKKMII